MSETLFWICYVLLLLIIWIHFIYIRFMNKRLKAFKDLIFNDVGSSLKKFCVDNWSKIILKDKYFYFISNYLLLIFYIAVLIPLIYLLLDYMFLTYTWYVNQKWPIILIITITVVYYVAILLMFSILIFKFWKQYLNIKNYDNYKNKLETFIETSNSLNNVKSNDTIINKFILVVNKKNNQFFISKNKNIYFHLNSLIWKYLYVYLHTSSKDYHKYYIWFGVDRDNKNKEPIYVVRDQETINITETEFLMICEKTILETYNKWKKQIN